MRRSSFSPEPDCAIAQSLAVVGDGWELLIVRDLARGLDRFDLLAESLRISRKVLTERLGGLMDSGVVERTAYQERPTRYAYQLTARGRALLPVLVALQDWGDRWVLGDGQLTGTNAESEPTAHRLHELVGAAVPAGLLLPATGGDGPPESVDVVDGQAKATVLFGYPATGRPTPLPAGWSEIAGAHGCTLENRLFAERYDEFRAGGIAVHGVSTQRPEEQAAFAEAEKIPHVLLSDVELQLAAALRLPTFRAGGVGRLKRFVLVVGADRVVRAVRYPVTDLADAVNWAFTTASDQAGGGAERRG
ncbi:transcriptional regulator, HxlR family [Kribbella flavida DSM 17836]|uniref:Transcriptional regulator, HxlR family n=1 Tax=Kribbella flavida (strain DSM 17836 / JCM 10339 / NBRC 14399) TaxID=479435 RepID=D2PUT8_KRIFD|nr:winged helix-turn-helix transcriptional regulator [Kribbella flavida]ADB31404.1 transcriptional regulator, HxlR family [Kribbella flavida DSM 17836]